MEQRKNNNSGDDPKERDLTAEMLEWAKDRRASAAKTMPSGVQPLEATHIDQERLKAKAQAKVLKGKMLVVTLHEGTTDWGQAHFFDGGEDASRFVETLMQGGVDQERVVVFRGSQMNVSVTFRPVVAIEQPEQQKAVAG